MTPRQKELRALIKQMTSAELSEAITLLQAEVKTRNHAPPPISHDWKHRLTR
jgi:hypothetical protein